ncbi:MAG: ribosome small subunit-dependent GTPase A [Clostridia bacterium]|nr:ribosome small subunit-dependent GTPase A [Clostridia bacterium]
MNGIIVKAISSFYYVDCSDTIYECKARGNFRKTGISPVVGDNVSFTVSDSGYAVIEEILPRKSFLERPTVANIEKIVIVSSYTCPEPNALLIDRLISCSVYNNIEPIIVFNKSDMGDFSKWYDIYSRSGFKTFVISVKDNIGIDLLKAEISDSFCAFAGNSGVGKSSVINSIFGDLSLKTGEVSLKLGRGRHTTRHTELFKTASGGYIADTPGFSSFESVGDLYDYKMHLAETFPEFSPYVDNCRFTSCTHTCEKGCGVLDAVENGMIQKSRHESYVTILNELKSVKEWDRKKI